MSLAFCREAQNVRLGSTGLIWRHAESGLKLRTKPTYCALMTAFTQETEVVAPPPKERE